MVGKQREALGACKRTIVVSLGTDGHVSISRKTYYSHYSVSGISFKNNTSHLETFVPVFFHSLLESTSTNTISVQ